MKLFKIFGVQIRVSLLFFFILFHSMFFNYFSQLLVLIIVVFLHELAHCCACTYYNIGISEIKIFIFGGMVKFRKYIEENPKQEIIIALAGPISNLILIIITFLIIDKLDIKDNHTIQLFLTSNMVIGLFNLIPILPLDGGRVIRGIMGCYLGIKRATHIIIKSGYFICMLLFAVGIYTALVYNIKYILISILSIYIFFANKGEKEKIDLIFMKNLVLKRKTLFRDGVMDSKYIIAMDFVNIKNIFDRFTLEQYCIITIVDETGRITGSLSESEIIDAIIKHGYNITLGKLL